MANLKLDLINKLNNEKFYAELELVRLAQEPNMSYRTKIDSMNLELEILAITNAKLGLVDQYFQEPAPQAAPPPPQADAAPAPPQADAAPQGKVHQGQSHGEA